MAEAHLYDVRGFVTLDRPRTCSTLPVAAGADVAAVHLSTQFLSASTRVVSPSGRRFSGSFTALCPQSCLLTKTAASSGVPPRGRKPSGCPNNQERGFVLIEGLGRNPVSFLPLLRPHPPEMLAQELLKTEPQEMRAQELKTTGTVLPPLPSNCLAFHWCCLRQPTEGRQCPVCSPRPSADQSRASGGHEHWLPVRVQSRGPWSP